MIKRHITITDVAVMLGMALGKARTEKERKAILDLAKALIPFLVADAIAEATK